MGKKLDKLVARVEALEEAIAAMLSGKPKKKSAKKAKTKKTRKSKAGKAAAKPARPARKKRPARKLPPVVVPSVTGGVLL